jgi:hypothetical protein
MLRSYALRRPRYFVAAMVLALSSVLPLVISQEAGAYGLLASREIRISTSDGAATDVTYLVNATTPTTDNIGSIVIEFCGNSPIIGDSSCTTPGGFDINEAGLALANQSGITNWTVHANTDTNTLVLNRAASASFTAGAFSLELGAGGGSDGVTNPTTDNTSFYARILTFADIDDDGDGCSAGDDWAGCYVSQANHNQSLHAGGIALSTAAQITVTSKVQERLVFCVYTGGAGYANNNCTGKSGTAVTLGDTNGVLDAAGPYVDVNARFSITTNAVSGATVRAKGATLTSGGNTITAIGSGTAEANSVAGSEQFGFCTYQFAGSGLTIDADYDGDNATGEDCADSSQTAGTGTPGGTGPGNDVSFAFITAEMGATYGSSISTKPAGDYSTGTLAFVGNISNTTEAGIYTSTLAFIATGTY